MEMSAKYFRGSIYISNMGVVQSTFPQDQLHIQDCTKFCTEVETLVATKRMGYMEAVLYLAEKRGIEPEGAAAYLNPHIKERIRIEATDLNLMPRTASLPF
jgi:hypothetical protein